MDKITLPLISPTEEIIKEQPPEKEETQGGIKNFDGFLSIISPESNRSIAFAPEQTVRSPKWSYPFPAGFLIDANPLVPLDQIIALLGANTTRDFLNESLTRRAQSLWKESLTKAAEEGVTPEDYFATFFFDINRRTGEDTPEKLGKEINNLLKKIKERKEAGAPIEELKGLKEEYLGLKAKQDELLLKGI